MILMVILYVFSSGYSSPVAVGHYPNMTECEEVKTYAEENYVGRSVSFTCVPFITPTKP